MKWMLGKDIVGRIYISAQGINAQYSGLREHAIAYAKWVCSSDQWLNSKNNACSRSEEETRISVLMSEYSSTGNHSTGRCIVTQCMTAAIIHTGGGAAGLPGTTLDGRGCAWAPIPAAAPESAAKSGAVGRRHTAAAHL